MSILQTPVGDRLANNHTDTARVVKRSQQITLHRTDDIHSAVQIVATKMESFRFSDRDIYAVRLSLEEALVNAIKHGNGGDPTKIVRMRYSVNARRVIAIIEDEGCGFNPDSVPDPTDPEQLESPCGRGLFIMRHYMNWVRHNSIGNIVTLCKRRSSDN